MRFVGMHERGIAAGPQRGGPIAHDANGQIRDVAQTLGEHAPARYDEALPQRCRGQPAQKQFGLPLRAAHFRHARQINVADGGSRRWKSRIHLEVELVLEFWLA